jgi:hypothetical protein
MNFIKLGNPLKGVFFVIICVCLSLGCFKQHKETIYTSNSEYSYICSDYTVEDNSGYFMTDALEYNLKFIHLKDTSAVKDINPTASTKFINSNLNEYNFGFKMASHKVEILPQLKNRAVRYRDLLGKYWEQEGHGYITIIVIPTSVILLKNNSVQGAAFGVPRRHNPSEGKPILFIRESHIEDEILIHELLHTFGGLHVFHLNEYFQGSGSTCDSDDRVSDTPVPSVGHGVSKETCTFYPGKASTLTKEEQDILKHNYLSYAPPNCMKTIEMGQIERFRFIASIHGDLKAAEVKNKSYDVFETIYNPKD